MYRRQQYRSWLQLSAGMSLLWTLTLNTSVYFVYFRYILCISADGRNTVIVGVRQRRGTRCNVLNVQELSAWCTKQKTDGQIKKETKIDYRNL